MYAREKRVYSVNQFEGMSPERVVLAMFDGAIKQMHRARTASELNEVRLKGEAVSRAVAIVAELQTALDPEAGEMSAQLDGLYDFVLRQLTDFNVHHLLEPLEQAEKVMQTLRAAWAELLEQDVQTAQTLASPTERYL
ncbi:MAG: flagellar export chaperone FliS [Myxococcota bacterium]